MSETFDLAQVYRDVEDYLVPYLRLGLGERAVYYHLLRHSRVEGRRCVQVSKRALARNLGCSATTVRGHVRRLAQKGCLRIVERSLAGHTIEVFTPDEIPGCVRVGALSQTSQLEAADCFRNERLRAAILRRENYACFYCLRRLPAGAAVFDHAVPLAAGGDNSYRNIVACCFECNSAKSDRPAEEFLRELYRASRLTAAEFDGRRAACEALRAGRLAPAV
jgi:predicted DNA-binding transcriptional regulator